MCANTVGLQLCVFFCDVWFIGNLPCRLVGRLLLDKKNHPNSMIWDAPKSDAPSALSNFWPSGRIKMEPVFSLNAADKYPHYEIEFYGSNRGVPFPAKIEAAPSLKITNISLLGRKRWRPTETPTKYVKEIVFALPLKTAAIFCSATYLGCDIETHRPFSTSAPAAFALNEAATPI